MLVRVQMFFTALTLAFGLLHLVLWAHLRRERSNLYYAGFLLLHALAIFCDFQADLGSEDTWEAYLRVHRAATAFSFIFALRFFYALFLEEPPRHFRYVAAGFAVGGLFTFLDPVRYFWPVQALGVWMLIESLRVTFAAIRRGVPGAWTIAAGFGVFVLFASYDLLLDIGAIPAFLGIDNAYQFGTVGLFMATSSYLAGSIARTNETLLARERTVQEAAFARRELEADLARKTHELNEARTLQRAMLPQALPERPDLRLAVHLETASEVGGDYYDVLEGDGGALTIAVGDATGHGLRAGLMVAIAKSLVTSALRGGDFPAFFERCTRTIRGMRLGNLFLSLTLVQVERRRLTAAAAGMPPILLYRAATGTTETLVLKGMPLGAFEGFPYPSVTHVLTPVDTVLMMSDGLPEAFNPDRVQLGLDGVRACFEACATETPEAIVARLRAEEAAWRAGAPAEDDVTFVVLQVV
ncbi:MAG TPA: SpoIIE family protein phosphatase [Rhodothermales bacterium]|nr:SpoIIE family protein phosphatase [Rhodothermales bacterium]